MIEDAILEVEGVHAGYTGEDILHGVSISVPRGRIVSVIGPNGSGKSTLLKSIYGIVRARMGSVRFRPDGTSIELRGLRPNEITARGANMVPQLANVFPEMSVLENLEIGSTLTRPSFEVEFERVVRLFPALRAALKKRAATLSGGQRQMLGIARALMSDPRLLILDEPSAGLAPNIVDEVFSKIREINASGVSILLVEQKARQCLAMSDRGYVLDQGRNRIAGTGAELLTDPEVVRLYLGGHGRLGLASRAAPEHPQPT